MGFKYSDILEMGWDKFASRSERARQKAKKRLDWLSKKSSQGNVVIKYTSFGGQCPFQAEGTLNGVNFYFRARGSSWALRVGGENIFSDPDWIYSEEYGTGPFDAGYMAEDEARAFLEKAANKWLMESSKA